MPDRWLGVNGVVKATRVYAGDSKDRVDTDQLQRCDYGFATGHSFHILMVLAVDISLARRASVRGLVVAIPTFSGLANVC